MSDVLATTMQQVKDVPVTIAVPELEGSQALNPQTVQLTKLRLCLFWYLPYWISPLLAVPQWGPICWVHCQPTRKKQDWSPSSSLGNHHDKRTHVNSQEVESRSEHSCTQGEEDMLTLALEIRPSSEPQGQEPTSPPSSPTRPLLILTMVQWGKP